MDKPRPRVAAKQPPEGWPTTAVGFQRQQRKAKRFITGIALVLIVGPFALAVLALLIFASGSGSAWSLLGLPFIMLAGLITVILPFLVPALFVLFAWAVIRQYYRKPDAAPVAAPPDAQAGTPSPLAAEVALLETLRRELAREARRRAWMFVPLGLGAALLLFYLMFNGSRSSKDSPVIAFILFMVIGGGGAWLYAVTGPGVRYAAAFKGRLLPGLLSTYGEMAHTIGTRPDLDRAVAAGFLPRYDDLSADDGFAGSYRGRPIRITEIRVTRKGAKSDLTLFQGLYVEITVSTPFAGVTIVRDPEGDEAGHDLHRLRLEDPVFEDIYAAYATDQVEGRAVLTPAVMERLLVMADGKSFLPPQFLLDGERMVFALPTITPDRLFEPPGLETHAAAQQLASLEADLATVFDLADAMIDMHIAVRGPRDATLETGRPTRTTTP